MKATWIGPEPTGIGSADHSAGRSIDNRYGIFALLGDIEEAATGHHGEAADTGGAEADGGGDRVGGAVDDSDVVAGGIADIGKGLRGGSSDGGQNGEREFEGLRMKEIA